MTVNSQNAPYMLMAFIIGWNDMVTIDAQIQLNAVANDAALPLILDGKISPNINQGIGPNPIENPRT